MNEGTGTAARRAVFPNPGRLLLPGQFVRAKIHAGMKTGGFLVPQRAVTVGAQGGTIMVVGQKNIAEPREVKLGELQGGNWIVRSGRSEEHTSELQSLLRISYAVFCLKKKHKQTR